MQDLVSYNDKHNENNGEGNRDGSDANFSWNYGVEGPTDDPEIVALRDRQKRNMLATLLLSLGVPMLLAGDEIGRTQQGNNNAYCQDNEISWTDWGNIRPEDDGIGRFVSYLIHLRRRHRVFSRPRFFRGEMLSEAGVKDITWVTPAGKRGDDEDWRNPAALSLGYVLSGAAGEFFTPGGQRDIDESFLVMMNAYYGDLDFRIPELAAPMSWEPLVDTSRTTGRVEDGRLMRRARSIIWRPLLRPLHQPRAATRAAARTAGGPANESVAEYALPAGLPPADEEERGFSFFLRGHEAGGDD